MAEIMQIGSVGTGGIAGHHLEHHWAEVPAAEIDEVCDVAAGWAD